MTETEYTPNRAVVYKVCAAHKGRGARGSVSSGVRE